MAGLVGSTGNEMVDSLQCLQRMVDAIDDEEARLGLAVLGAEELLGRRLRITALGAFGRRPDAPQDIYIPFAGYEIELTATPDQFVYMQDRAYPVDALTFSLRYPRVRGVRPERVSAFQRLIYRVPVLAILSCEDDME